MDITQIATPSTGVYATFQVNSEVLLGKEHSLFKDKSQRTFCVMPFAKAEWSNLKTLASLDLIAKNLGKGRQLSVFFDVNEEAGRSRSIHKGQVVVLKEIRFETFVVGSLFRAVIVVTNSNGTFDLLLDGKENARPFMASPQIMYDNDHRLLSHDRAIDGYVETLVGERGEGYFWGEVSVVIPNHEETTDFSSDQFLPDLARNFFNAVIAVKINTDGVLPKVLTDRATKLSLPALLLQIAFTRAQSERKESILKGLIPGTDNRAANGSLVRQIITHLESCRTPIYKQPKAIAAGAALAIFVLCLFGRGVVVGRSLR